tara:strand:- start:1071 stop:1385 length:315 start_codon:yes stop_codon:yes gene_type:complete
MSDPESAHIMPVEPELDLHTFHPRDVKSVISEYLFAVTSAGYTQVRIIHGRGTGTQRAMVHAELTRHPSVVQFWDSPESHLGATIAEIRVNADFQSHELTKTTR